LTDRARLADQLTGRAFSLALAPGVDPVVAVAELVALAAGDRDAVELACSRFRTYLLDFPDSATARMAMDLLDEVLALPLVALSLSAADPSAAPAR
jgi:hypothetical protein